MSCKDCQEIDHMVHPRNTGREKKKKTSKWGLQWQFGKGDWEEAVLHGLLSQSC